MCGSATAGMIFSVAYGIEVKNKEDPFVVTAERTLEAVDATLVPGSYLVDLIPSCEYFSFSCLRLSSLLDGCV